MEPETAVLIVAALLSVPEVKTASPRCLVHMNSCGSNTAPLMFRSASAAIKIFCAVCGLSSSRDPKAAGFVCRPVLP